MVELGFEPKVPGITPPVLNSVEHAHQRHHRFLPATSAETGVRILPLASKDKKRAQEPSDVCKVPQPGGWGVELGWNTGLVFEMRARNSMARALNIELSPGLTTSLETLVEHEVPCLPRALLRGSHGMQSQGFPAHATHVLWQNGKPGAGLLWPTSPSLPSGRLSPPVITQQTVPIPQLSCCK